MEASPAVLARLGPQGPVLCGPRSPFLRADDVGVLRGDGVFERFLVDDGRPRHLKEHLARLHRSAALCQLAVPEDGPWRAAVACAIDAWPGPAEWEMRLVCTRGPEEGGPPTAYVLGQALTAGLVRQRREGIGVVTVVARPADDMAAEAPWLLLGAKTLSYAVNVAAKRFAESRGADDAIFVSVTGQVFEGPTSSVVACFGPRLVSPPTSLGILDSISVARLFEMASSQGWDVGRDQLSVDSLLEADGVWMSSSLRLARVHTLDGKTLPPASAHEELAALAARA
jgi:4-amino-4-deoxychorismate lyase